ncbi:MAG: F0F1 ATP synthase subunit A [Leptospiraceae bacterium]|nr:F0F1 ATP synthase subunit A [Leptospiraceae bacterium]MCK6381399.1 F0F1 ATP synthase subunit A [Leptospiraceae bacterium]NUM42214.1 F0F1 ATP synthase subunit A [Leptospiraceae bacterium]
MIKKSGIILLLALFSTFALNASDSGKSGGAEEFDLAEILVHHLADHAEFPLNIGGERVYEGTPDFDPENHGIFYDKDASKRYHFKGGLDLHITKRVAMMWLVALALFAVFIPAGRIISRNPFRVQSKFASFVEVFVGFVKKDVADQNMHGHGHAYYHYLLSLFFFVLFSNLFGIIPPIGEVVSLFMPHPESLPGIHEAAFPAKIWNGITVTGDVSVTMTLSIVTLILIYATGFSYQGIKFIVHSVPNGVPLALFPLMWPLEFIVSPLAKAFALTVRLLANMTAGHVIILALLGFIFEFKSYYIVPISVIGAGAIYVLEIFVAFLQAFIFTLLTALFVGASMHRH